MLESRADSQTFVWLHNMYFRRVSFSPEASKYVVAKEVERKTFTDEMTSL
ncbi:MAG: hypothetical protein HRT38_02635 [Alteromonadaceae bacterium]|nr:hypothetical protein [Alteromonadaceae bacterium]